LALGAFLCVFHDYLKGGSLDGFLPVRYLLLLMGFFGTYMGFIYNEFFAIPINFFGTCYTEEPDFYNKALTGPNDEYGYHRKDFDCVYGFGVDPVWEMSD